MSVRVGVSVRFVPAGLRGSAQGGWMLHGAMVLTPVPGSAGESCGTVVDLADWPREIERLVAPADLGPGKGAAGSVGFAITLSPVKDHEALDSRPSPDTDTLWLPAYRAYAVGGTVQLTKKRAEHAEASNTAWKTLLTPASAVWEDIATALMPGGANSILKRIRRDTGDGTGPVPDIVANGRGEMGLLLALERGKSIMNRVKAPADQAGGDDPRATERLRTRAPGKQSDQRDNEMPWLDTRGPPAEPPRADDPPEELRRRAVAERAARSKLANTQMEPERKAAAAQAKNRDAYRNAATAHAIGDALRSAAAGKPGCGPPQMSAACVADDRETSLQAALDRNRALHYAATRATEREGVPWGGRHPTSPLLSDVEAARSRFFAVQSQPTLARLFNLTIDVVVPLDAAVMDALKAAKLHRESIGSGKNVQAVFAFVAARVCPAPGTRRIWTTAKLRLPTHNMTEGAKASPGKAASPPQPRMDALHFWACTREELDARAIGWCQDDMLDNAIASQVDGMIDLAASRMEGVHANPRFELATLDVPRVTEADLHADAQARRSVQKTTAVGTFASGGLLLVDRWRQHHAVAQAADSMARGPAPNGTIIIDVEDLTVGLKLDVGVTEQNATKWRSLVERKIVFGNVGPLSLEAVADTLIAKGERDGLNSAVLTLPARLRANAAGEQSGAVPALGPETAFVEEVVAQWNGPPLGVDLHGSEASRLPDANGTPDLSKTNLLQLSQTYSLLDKGELPPRQCFGWPYRVGVRPQLAGGVSLPLERARAAYDSGYRNRFALPSAGPGRRVLRHERVEAPVVTTPTKILQRIVSGPRETGTELVVRGTVTNGVSTPLVPSSTHRVMVPPSVSLEFTDRHDVFTDAGPDSQPRGGLLDVSYDRRTQGTFPVWSTQHDSEGELYPDDPTKPKLPDPTGDAAFEPRNPSSKPSSRRQPYYPDPAADLMVFRLRREDGSDIDGASLVVRTRRKGVAYPDVTPVAVELVALPRRTGVPTQDRIGLDVGGGKLTYGHTAWKSPAARLFLDAGQTIHAGAASGRVEASRVVVQLEPGERFQLDVWCLPYWEHLSDWFDVVEASILVAQSSGDGAGACLSGAAFCARVAAMAGRTPGELLAILGPIGNSDGPPGGVPCGAGQLALPGIAERDWMAKLLQATAFGQVAPEISARTTLWVTHAIDKPLLAPLPHAAPLPGLRVHRVNDKTRASMLHPQASPTPPDATDGDKDVVVDGWIRLDHATTGFLEVVASGASLSSGAFDDPTRGRSIDDRARGIWPEHGTAADGSIVYRRTRDVFGFAVNPDGTVALPKETATLIRFDTLPPPVPAQAPEAFDLLLAQRLLGPPDAPRLRPGVAYPQTIADTKARVLHFSLVAGSKTSPFIRRTDGSALWAAEQTHVVPVSTAVALQSTKMPARVSPMTILPAFRITQHSVGVGPQPTTFQLTRHTRLRIRARRPWFSSGEGERLGIVLWPPLFFDDVILPNADEAYRDYDVDRGEADSMGLRGFSDLDLGPGGGFVSRWGGDPANPGTRPSGWLMPPSAFRQAPRDSGMSSAGATRLRKPWTPLDPEDSSADVVYVPRATMPLPADPAQAGPAPEANPSFEVALLTYRPRFDVDAEHWYFDVDLDPAANVDPFVRLGLVRYQPNAPRHLRVSEPVVEWAQLLPLRSVEVHLLPRNRNGAFPVQVIVSGPAWTGVGRPASQEPSRTQAADADVRNGPLMDVAVYVRDPDGIEQPAPLWQPTGGDQEGVGSPRRVLPRSGTAAGVVWDTTFELEHDPGLPGLPDRTYSVVVTEVRAMRPATYVNEPFDPDHAETEDRVVDSGPRFAARVHIRLAPPTNEAPIPLSVHMD